MPKKYGNKKLKGDMKKLSCADTSCAKRTPAYSKAKDLKVEENIKKDKEVKEKDVFDFSSKKK